MPALARNVAILLCALALLLVPVAGSIKGQGGLVNLPGGGVLNCTSGGGGGALTPVVVRADEDLTLVLHPTMWGSVAVVGSRGIAPRTVVATTSGRYWISAADLRTLGEAGVKVLEIEFVAPNGTALRVDVAIELEANKITVTVRS